MKRNFKGERKQKQASISEMFGGSSSLSKEKCGKWNHSTDLMIFIHNDMKHGYKIAAFDMDGTIIKTKSNKVFPVDTYDWVMWDEAVIPKLQSLHKEGFKIVFFTNQKGITVGKVDRKGFQSKVENIINTIGVPVVVLASLTDGVYRKPSTGMWDHFIAHFNGGVEVDMSASIFVGDAAGRHPTSTSKKDHSCADRFFAWNIGLKFKTPEQFFLGLDRNAEQKWGPPSFDPIKYLAADRSQNVAILPSSTQEVVVMVGFPGSGKSTIARKWAEDHGYQIVSRDTLGTWQKCVAQAKKELEKGHSVIVDNTNPDKDSRSRYISMALSSKVPVRCIEMTTDFETSAHNVRYRTLYGEGAKVSTMVLRMYKKNFQKPELEEGFCEIVRADFVPKFENDEEKKLWSQFLLDF